MTSQVSRRTLRVLVAAAVCAGIAVSATGSASGLLVEPAPSCEPQPVSYPFKQFGDGSAYMKVPGGNFEGTASGWSFSNARIVTGNSTYYAGGAGHTRSLSISPGGSATTPTICVGLEHPTMRFFAKSSGLLPSLSVEVIVRTSLGLKVPVPLGVVTPRSSWKPSQKLIVVANLLPLLPGNHTPVNFRFSAVTGTWSIDDVYVDPKRH